MRKPLQPEYLFHIKKASVSPSWVKLNKTSYAVRTITKLTLRKARGPHPSVYALLLVFLLLTVYCALQIKSQGLPVIVGVPMFVLSAVLVGVTAWLAFAQRPQFRVSIGMYDGSTAHLKLPKEQEAKDLHDAITRAMDWHRNSGADSELIATVVARRKAANA